MWLLRVGRESRWKSDSVDSDFEQRVTEAAKDLALRSGEAGLSVYKVRDANHARAIGLEFVRSHREDEKHVDYVLIDESALHAACVLDKTDDDGDLDGILNESHYEIVGLTPTIALDWARALLRSGDVVSTRIKRQDVEAYLASKPR